MSSPVPITFDTLEDALQWVSVDGVYENQALLSVATGKLFLRSTFADVEEELPDDIDDETAYITFPDQRDLDLGRDLVFAFADLQEPTHAQTIKSFFSRRGAYGNFENFLSRTNLLEGWYEYEAAATRKALEEWAHANGFVVVPDQPQA